MYRFIDASIWGVGYVSDAGKSGGHIIEKQHSLKERPILREGSKRRHDLADVSVRLLWYLRTNSFINLCAWNTINTIYTSVYMNDFYTYCLVDKILNWSCVCVGVGVGVHVWGGGSHKHIYNIIGQPYWCLVASHVTVAI